jgi:hypothetical protein
VVDADVKPPALTEGALRAYFEGHRTQYDEPARFDFDEAVMAGPATESSVRAFVDRLNHGAPGDAEAGLRVFKGRPLANLTDSYGDGFAAALEAGHEGEWRAIPTKGGWRAIHIGAITPARPADFQVVRNLVQGDFVDDDMAQKRTDAVRTLARKYTLKVEASTP